MNKKGVIGIQLSTIKSKINELGVYETMRKCAQSGYHCIEISQVPMTNENVNEFKRAQNDFGITVAAINAGMTSPFPGMESLETDYEKIVADCQTLNCSMLRIGSGPRDLMVTRDGILKYCEELNKYTDRLKADGIYYYYHNHASEFCKLDGEYVLDILKNNSNIGFELDIHWVQAGGENPIDIIRRYAGRIRLLHLKDYRIVPVKMDLSRFRRPPESPDSSLAQPPQGRPEPNAVNPQYAAIQFAEIGEGNLDIKGCIEAGLAGGSEYFLIEQDRTYDRDPFDSLRISRENLVKLGYADWF